MVMIFMGENGNRKAFYEPTHSCCRPCVYIQLTLNVFNFHSILRLSNEEKNVPNFFFPTVESRHGLEDYILT